MTDHPKYEPATLEGRDLEEWTEEEKKRAQESLDLVNGINSYMYQLCQKVLEVGSRYYYPNSADNDVTYFVVDKITFKEQDPYDYVVHITSYNIHRIHQDYPGQSYICGAQSEVFSFIPKIGVAAYEGPLSPYDQGYDLSASIGQLVGEHGAAIERSMLHCVIDKLHAKGYHLLIQKIQNK